MLRRAVPFDAACGHTMDPATRLLTRQFSEQFDADGFALICRNEYLQRDVNKFASLARRRPAAVTLRDATGGVPTKSARYREILLPFGFGPELRATFSAAGESWASLVVLRNQGGPEFTPTEQRFVHSLGNHIANAVRRSLLFAAARGDAQSGAAPGLILLSPADELEAINAPAREWLEQLTVRGSSPGPRGLPGSVFAVAAAARRVAGNEGAPGPPRLRVQTRSGRWLVLHGSVIGTDDKGRTAVIIEVARGLELAPLIAAAYGLTPREREIARLVLQGRATEDMARELWLSPYTVQDHMKSIFAKVGVRSRRALAARIFFEHYEPRERSGAELSSDGWYTDRSTAGHDPALLETP